MSEEKAGGQAFPTMSNTEYIPGMTLRDWFAGQVEVEIDLPIESAEKLLGRSCPKWQEDYLGNIRFWAELEAFVRGIKADAMLAERAKE